jgi:magnesium chelatase subunit D
MSQQLAAADRITRGLACAALNPGLGAVLLLDATAEDVAASRATMQALLAVTRGPVREVVVGSNESDDVQLGCFAPDHTGAVSSLAWRPGRLVPASDDGVILALIPDLERLGLAATRTLLTLIGTDVIHIERHGWSGRFDQRCVWLAACSSEGTSRVSAHLLDRFVLRLRAKQRRRQSTAVELSTLLQVPGQNDARSVQLSEGVKEGISAACRRSPAFTEDGIGAVIEYELSPRREIALARLAHSLARMAPSGTEVHASHVADAAHLIGLRPMMLDRSGRSTSPLNETDAEQETSATERAATTGLPQTNPGDESAPNSASGEPYFAYESECEELPATHLLVSRDPFPEDTLTPQRDSSPLRQPPRRASQVRATRGAILGTEAARHLCDVAIVSTLLEAAKFRLVRSRSFDAPGRSMRILATDLRTYRRAPSPDQVLVLLLDYTSLVDCQWLDALMPYLKWAYVKRASVCLVQVGAADSRHPLRAERRMFSSVVVPALGQALEVGPGQATPLAHGLELARQALQQALQHGRQSAHEALLVVLSDGRGNVPLEASAIGMVSGPIGFEGVTDALLSAERLRTVVRGDVVFLNPMPQAYPELPLALSRALGTQPRDVPLLEDREVDA